MKARKEKAPSAEAEKPPLHVDLVLNDFRKEQSFRRIGIVTVEAGTLAHNPIIHEGYEDAVWSLDLLRDPIFHLELGRLVSQQEPELYLEAMAFAYKGSVLSSTTAHEVAICPFQDGDVLDFISDVPL